MTRIILDASSAGKLHALCQPAELCDADGRVIGEFIPRTRCDAGGRSPGPLDPPSSLDLDEWEPQSPDISEEELERRSKSSERRYTTAEVISQLEKL